MNPRPVLLVTAVLLLSSCAPHSGRVYAGSPGSTYDANSNPAQTNGVVTYDPTIPAKPRDFGNSGSVAAASTVH